MLDWWEPEECLEVFRSSVILKMFKTEVRKESNICLVLTKIFD